MRYRLRTLLVLAAIGPPLLAAAWFTLRVVAQTVANASWEYHLKPFLIEAGSMALLIALLTTAAVLIHRTNRAS